MQGKVRHVSLASPFTASAETRVEDMTRDFYRLDSRARQRMKLSGVITTHIIRMPQPHEAP